MAGETGERVPSIPEPETHEVAVPAETLQRLSEFSKKALSTQVALAKVLTSGDDFHLATDRLENLRDNYGRLHLTVDDIRDVLAAGRSVEIHTFEGGVTMSISTHPYGYISTFSSELFRQLVWGMFPQNKGARDRYSETYNDVIWHYNQQHKIILKPSQ